MLQFRGSVVKSIILTERGIVPSSLLARSTPAGNHPVEGAGLPGFQRDPCLRDVAFDPGRAAAPRDGGATHMGFDSRHGLGLCDLTNYVAQSHTPQAHCVRRSHPQHSLPGGSLGLTWAGPPPAGSRWLRPSAGDFNRNQQAWRHFFRELQSFLAKVLNSTHGFLQSCSA